MPNFTQYRDPTDTTRTPSPAIWADCPTLEILQDPGRGYHFYDDFQNFAPLTTALVQNDKYWFTGDTGVLIADSTTTADGGHIFMDDLDTDNDAGFLVHGLYGPFARLATTDNMWFECRYKRSAVADNDGGLFLGLYETTVVPSSGTTLVDDTSVLDASEDFVGWRILAADGNALEPIYQEGGQTIQAVGSGSTNAVGSGNDRAIVADTFIKLGMKFIGARGGGQGRIEYYVNGGLHAWYEIDSSANWPDANHLAMAWFESANAATDIQRTLDWWRVASTGANTAT